MGAAPEDAFMGKMVAVYVAALVAMLVPDAGWLGIMGPNLYKPALGDMMATNFSPIPAVLFYLLYVAGLTYFSNGDSIASSAAKGAFFGLCAYGTYDLTNNATLRNWPAYLTVADLAWGTILSGFAAGVAAWVRVKLA
jgi:uncharacterized membrane protein